MPLVFFLHVVEHGLPPRLAANLPLIINVTVAVAVLVLVKLYWSGASLPSALAERKLHGKIVLLTGGTSGIGAAVALDLARRGAQLVLLTQTSPADPFVAEFVQDLRDRTDNQLVYAEQVDLASLHSVRTFATRWIDNAPPRRLDMIVLCAATMSPPGGRRRETAEGAIEETWMVNFLANFHLLGILSPAIRAQPFDRDMRVIMVSCRRQSHASWPSLRDHPTALARADNWSPAAAYAHSKLALMSFGKAFQKHIDAYKRPDGLPPNARVIFVDPGLCRTPGMRRWLTRGSLWGLCLYLATYAFSWLFLKSPRRGAQSVIYATLAPELGRDAGGRMVKECREVVVMGPARTTDVDDEGVAEKLWQASDKLIERVEKEQAVVRARAKKAEEEKAKEQTEKDRVEEIDSLVGAIKKGKAKESSAVKPKKGKK